VTGFPYDQNQTRCAKLWSFRPVQRSIAGLPPAGSAALDLCYVAAGRMDIFFEIQLKPYDIAAGLLLVQEAGGMVSKFDGSTDYLTMRSALRLPTQRFIRSSASDPTGIK